MELTDLQKLAAKRLRDTQGLSFGDSFALVSKPECDVAALATEEQKARDAERDAFHNVEAVKQPEPLPAKKTKPS